MSKNKKKEETESEEEEEEEEDEEDEEEEEDDEDEEEDEENSGSEEGSENDEENEESEDPEGSEDQEDPKPNPQPLDEEQPEPSFYQNPRSGVESIKSISYDLEAISDEIDKLFNMKLKSVRREESEPLPDFYQAPRFDPRSYAEDPGKDLQYSPKSNLTDDPGSFSVHSKFYANPQRPVPQPKSIEEFYNNPRKVDEPISLVKETKPRTLGFFNRNAPPYF